MDGLVLNGTSVLSTAWMVWEQLTSAYMHWTYEYLHVFSGTGNNMLCGKAIFCGKAIYMTELQV